MPWPPPITGIEQLRDRPEVQRLLAWNQAALNAATFDRGELTLQIPRHLIRDTCAWLRDDSELRYNFLADVTCVDWYPSEPRFHVVYHLLSMSRRARLRLKVLLNGDDPSVDSVTGVWPAANFFEREVYDLFGVRFNDHPYLRRLLMPENWEGYPLRKDYPVEGFR